MRSAPISRWSNPDSLIRVTGTGSSPAALHMTTQMPGLGSAGAPIIQGDQGQLTQQPVKWEGPAGYAATPQLEGPAEVGEVAIAVPGLLVLDVSWSMQRDLASAEAALDRFTRKLRQNAAVSSSAWLGIVTFADTARTDLMLGRIADPATQLPKLEPRGNGTNFHAAFTEALVRLRTDLPLLQNAGGGRRQVFRPTIYFVSDGESNSNGPDWHGPLAEIKSRRWHPNVIAFGYREAYRDTIREIASEGMAYFPVDGQDPDTMFQQILDVILKSVITATVTVQQRLADPSAPATTPMVNPQDDKATSGLALIDPITTID
jgi:uncharacterized protein YegL